MSENFIDSLKGQDKKVEETLEYLSDKYGGQKFVYKGSEYLHGKLLVYCYPDWGTYDTERVRVRRETVDGEVEYMDTYFNIVMREDVEAEAEAICADLGLKGKAFFSADDSYIDNQFDSSKTYLDYMKWDLEDGDIDFTRLYNLVIATNDFADREKKADEIIKGIEAKNIRAGVYVNFCTNEKFENYHRDNLDELKNIEPENRLFKVTGKEE